VWSVTLVETPPKSNPLKRPSPPFPIMIISYAPIVLSKITEAGSPSCNSVLEESNYKAGKYLTAIRSVPSTDKTTTV
jgi:hypothetical protein